MAVAVLLLISHTRLHVFVPGAEVLRPALLVGVVTLALWVVQKNPLRSLRCFKDPVSRPAIFIAIWAVATVPFAVWPAGTATSILDRLLTTVLVFMMAVAAVRSLEDVRRLMGVFALGVGLYAILAPAGGEVRGMSAGGYDPNDAAMFLVSGFPVLVFFLLFGRRPLFRILAGAGAFAFLVGLVDTGSRGGFLAFAAVLAFMVTMLRGISPAFRAAVVAVTFLGMVPLATAEYWERIETITELEDGYGADDDLRGRWAVWGRGVGYWAQNPVSGVGMDNFTFMEGRHPAIQARLAEGRGIPFRAPHSQWVQVLAELGVVGFIAYVLVFVRSFRNLRGLQVGRGALPPQWRTRETRVMAGVLMASLLAVAVGGSFLSNSYNMATWGIWALIVALLKVLHFQRASSNGTHGSGP